jgi:nucleoside-diphosphate-sugar epimerase
MKAVVTGVAGFIGSHIAERLIKEGYEVFGIDDLSAGYTENIPKGVKWIPEDICKPERYSHFLDGADVIFHNAASKKNICLKNPCRDMEVNGIGTLKLLTECLAKGVKKFIHASTGSVYGEVIGTITENTSRKPCSYYGVSKLAGEGYVNLFHHLYGMDTTILRYFHVYGPRQEKSQETGGVVAIFCDKIKNNIPLIIHGDGSQRRVFTYVDDIVEANIQSWLNPLSRGKIYNCASSFQVTIKELAGILLEYFGKDNEIVYADPLIGDIYSFNVDSSHIKEIGVSFRSIHEVYENSGGGLCL